MVGGATHGEARVSRALIDTNVILDVLLARQPWLADAAALRQAHEERRTDGSIAATTLTNIFHVVRRNAGLERAHQSVRVCPATFEILAVDRRTLAHAATMRGNDFEDNVLIACATRAAVDMIVTRDAAGFRGAPIAVLRPAEALAGLGTSGAPTSER